MRPTGSSCRSRPMSRRSGPPSSCATSPIRLGCRDRLAMVVNRANSGVTVADMERTVGMPAFALIRSGGLLFVRAANEGRTVDRHVPEGEDQHRFRGARRPGHRQSRRSSPRRGACASRRVLGPARPRPRPRRTPRRSQRLRSVQLDAAERRARERLRTLACPRIDLLDSAQVGAVDEDHVDVRLADRPLAHRSPWPGRPG